MIDAGYNIELRGRGYASTMELTDIQTVRENAQEDRHWLEISGSGTASLRIIFYTAEEAASKFASVLRNAIEQVKAKTPAPNSAASSNVEEQIRLLKRLLRSGTITEAQFQQKLQEIVNQL